jgi:hypothetical protein
LRANIFSAFSPLKLDPSKHKNGNKELSGATVQGGEDKKGGRGTTAKGETSNWASKGPTDPEPATRKPSKL